ncbi:MAG TPA: hypothetical protein VH678_04825 [Xanthobacteraceae bacterium]
MTGNAINAKSEALEPDELSAEELEAVSGGTPTQAQMEGKKQADAIKGFEQMLQELP